MDIQMPYVTGHELIIALKADDGLRDIPVMAVTCLLYTSDAADDQINGVLSGGGGGLR